MRNFQALKDVIKIIKREAKDLEKIFADHISAKGIVFRKKQRTQFNNKRNNLIYIKKQSIALTNHRGIQMRSTNRGIQMRSTCKSAQYHQLLDICKLK